LLVLPFLFLLGYLVVGLPTYITIIP